MEKKSTLLTLGERMKKHRLPMMPVIWGATCPGIGVLVAIGLYSYHSAEKAMAAQFNRQQSILAQQAAQGIELGVIKSELDRLLEVLEEYLQFARLLKVKLEVGQVNEVVSDLLLFLREEAADRKAMVVEELEASLPPVKLDAKQLRQALLNIMKKSFDAMPDGGKLTVTTARKEGRVEMAIGDTGKGIPPENQDQSLPHSSAPNRGEPGWVFPLLLTSLRNIGEPSAFRVI